MGISIGLGLGARTLVGFVPPPFSSIASDGWRVTASGVITGETYSIQRAGFDANGAATTIADSGVILGPMRNPFPNQATFSSTDYVANEYIYADDVVLGATNNSTEVSPKPICRWAMPDRMVVGSTFHWEIVALHQNAGAVDTKPVASVHVRATNGTNSTSWQIVSSMSLSTYIEDARPTAVYQGDLDISALPDGLYWLEAKVFPHFGVAASIMESASTAGLREFGRRYFTKDAALAAAPPYVYVASTGNDTTGVVSTTAATAAASPCLTLQGAINRAVATLPSGKLDGLIVRIVDTVAFGTSAASSRNQSSGAIIVERAPGTARSAAIVQQSSAQNFRLGLGGNLDASLSWGTIIFKDVTIQRTASGQIGNGGTPNLHVQLWNCAMSHGSVAGAWGGTSQAISHFGAVLTNLSTTTLSYTANQTQYMLRGVIATPNSGYEGGCVIGSTLTGANGPTFADAQTGAVWYNSAFPAPASSGAPVAIAAASAGQTITGVAMVQCFIEPTHTTSTTPAFRPSSDSANGNITHAVIHHNVTLGAGILGRWNIFYDETPATARTHKFVSLKGNICPQINVKGDVFMSDGTRLGNRPLIHGVGCRGNFTKYQVNAVASEAQAYAGPGSNIGTSVSVLNNPLFTNDRGTTFTAPSTYTAGAGGSDVTLQVGSPCRDIVAELLLPFDFAGNARSGTQDAGVYA